MTRREEIEQAAMQVGGVHPDWDALECFRVGYKEGAKWADKTMIDKACDWLDRNVEKYESGPRMGYIPVSLIEDMINDFRKAMEK